MEERAEQRERPAGEVAAGGVAAGGDAGWVRALAALSTGLGGATGVMAWFGVHSWLRGEYWWAKFNVAAAPFYGQAVYGMGLGRATLAGFALLFLVYAAVGAGFAVVGRPAGWGRNFLLAAGWAGLWHVAAQAMVWRSLDVFGPSYFPLLAVAPAHVVLALSLSRYGSLHAKWKAEVAGWEGGAGMESGEAGEGREEEEGRGDC